MSEESNDDLKWLPIASLLLNPANFRHARAETQEDCIRALFEADPGYLLNLATDITQRGMNPAESLIVKADGKSWMVREGNRRTAALKALRNPATIPDLKGFSPAQMTALRAKFDKLAAANTPPQSVRCVVVDHEIDIDHWVTLKHTGPGQHKGAGVIPWGPEGRARHEAATSEEGPSDKQAGRAVLLLDELARQFPGSPTMIDGVANARARGITTLGRLLTNQQNHVRLGLSFESQVCRFVVTSEAIARAFGRILTDLGTPDLNSRSINTSADVERYLDGIQEYLPSAADRPIDGDENQDAGNNHGHGGDGDGSGGHGSRRRARKTTQPAKKPLKSLTLRHASRKTKDILAELKLLTFADHPYSIAILTRVLLDLYSIDVLNAVLPREKAKKETAKTTGARVQACLRRLEPENVVPKHRRFKLIHDALASGSGDLSVDSMHFYVHRHDYRAQPDAARYVCEVYEPFLRALDDYVDQTP